MISCLFSVAIHGLLLFVGVAAGVALYGKPLFGLPPSPAAAFLTIIIMGALLILSITPLGEWFLRWRNKCRKPTQEEGSILWPAWETVCRAAGYDPAAFRLWIIHSRENNAFALGSKTIAVTSACLYGTNDEELRGVLAHELGHHEHHDTLWLTMGGVAEQIGISVFNIIAFLSRIVGILAIIPLVGFVAALVTIALRLVLTAFEWLIIGPWRLGFYFGSRRSEYAADRYAAEIGFGEGQQSYLHKYGDRHEGWFSWAAALKSTHPHAKKRIQKLQKYREALRNA